jgi:O-antigen ligase
MHLSPILWFEIGTAIVTGIGVLWAKPEYGLFLYALALGFPDFAVPLGTTTHLRLDDVLLVPFLLRAVLWSPAPLSRSQRSIFKWQSIFLAACIFSIAVETAQGSPPEAYNAAKMAGCTAIVVVISRVVQSEKRLRFFVAGLMCAGIALEIQVRQHLDANPSSESLNFQQLKSAATFTTWNPNTIGDAAILLVFAAGLGWIIYSETLAGRILWPSLGVGFAAVPAFLFVRGSSLSIAAGFTMFLCLLRRWKSLVLFAAVCLCTVLYLYTLDRERFEGAATLNVATGEGFSERFNRWDMAVRAIQAKPLIGHGLGQELLYLTQIGGEGVAHNDYMTAWLELGAGGLLLFVVMLFQFVRAGWLLYGTPRFQRHGALILAVTFALCLDSLALPTLYWEKLSTIALSLAAAVVGLCERNDLEIPLLEDACASTDATFEQLHRESPRPESMSL